MNKKCLFLYLLICLLVVSCVSLKEPDSKNQTLVVGMMTVQANATTYKSNIEIQLQELNGTKIYQLLTQANGIFFSTNIPQGSYKLDFIGLPSNLLRVGDYSRDYFDDTRTIQIEVINGKVNNLGTFFLIFPPKNNNSTTLMQYSYNREYEQVRTLFQQRNSSSNWNQKEWINKINNGINIANSGGHAPPVTPVVQSSPATSVTSVILNKTSISLNMGSSETLTATITPYNATNQSITWTTSNTNVARVSGGTVTAVAAGTATITVSTVDGNYIDTCTVTVSGVSTSPAATVAQSSQPAQTPAPAVQPAPTAPAPAPAAQQNVPAPQKYALVIGNGAYRNLSRLNNPVNDANDMAAALQSMGFVVDKLIDASQDQMDSAVTRLKNRLSVSTNSYGFFFYAGHGVQSNGENYLIPVDANIPGENYLRSRAVSVQVMLNELNDARNDLNVIVLDACRDNPFGWARAGSRGLTVLSGQPAKSIIVYATSAGSTAADGTGRNGLFTSQLLKNITTPGLEVSEIFRRTGADVITASGGQQTPAIYSQFFGTAVLKN